MIQSQDRSRMLYVAEAARRAGVNPSAVRYYERRGLLPRAARSPSGYRVLGGETVERLRFIRQAQALGLRLAEICEILRLRDHGEAPCGRVRELATTRLRSIDEKIAELRRFRRSLAGLLRKASSGSVDDSHICPLIETASRQRESGARSAGRRLGSKVSNLQ